MLQLRPDASISVLLAAAFPRVVRRREVAQGVDHRLQLLVRLEFRAIVERERPDAVRLRVDELLQARGRLRCAAAIGFTDGENGEARAIRSL